jgi:hypothetical protein
MIEIFMVRWLVVGGGRGGRGLMSRRQTDQRRPMAEVLGGPGEQRREQCWTSLQVKLISPGDGGCRVRCVAASITRTASATMARVVQRRPATRTRVARETGRGVQQW